MQIRVIQVPYDSGHRDWRAGQGPGYLVENGLAGALEDRGHALEQRTVEAQAPTFEIQTGFELLPLIARQVETAVREGAFPLVIAGNCNSALGGISGLGTEPVGLIWFDAHGDFNTPETTPTGFLDGMGLATAVGLCWKQMMSSHGLRTLPQTAAALVGARDLDEEEREMLEHSAVHWVPASKIHDGGAAAALAQPLEAMGTVVRRVYVHIDLDVLDPTVCRANRLPAAGGLSLEQLEESIAAIGERFAVVGAGVASIEPEYEQENRTLRAGLQTLLALVQAGSRGLAVR